MNLPFSPLRRCRIRGRGGRDSRVPKSQDAVFEEWVTGACGKWSYLWEMERLNLTCVRLPL